MKPARSTEPTRINDSTFVRSVFRSAFRFGVTGRASRAILSNTSIEVVDFRSHAGFEVHIADTRGRLLGIGWCDGRAFVVPCYTAPMLAAIEYDAELLTCLVYHFLRRHQFVDVKGLSNRRSAA